MAQSYRPIQIHTEVVDRLNEFKERVGNQVFMNPIALGLSSSIGLLLDIEALVSQTGSRALTLEVIAAMAKKYPQRGRPRVSRPGPATAAGGDRGHDLSSFGPGVRACSICHIRFGDDEEIFAQCQGAPGGSDEL